MDIHDFKSFALDKARWASIDEQRRILKMIDDINDFLEEKLMENRDITINKK